MSDGLVMPCFRVRHTAWETETFLLLVSEMNWTQTCIGSKVHGSNTVGSARPSGSRGGLAVAGKVGRETWSCGHAGCWKRMRRPQARGGHRGQPESQEPVASHTMRSYKERKSAARRGREKSV